MSPPWGDPPRREKKPSPGELDRRRQPWELTVREVAALIGRHPRTVRNAIKARRIAARQISGRWHVDARALELTPEQRARVLPPEPVVKPPPAAPSPPKRGPDLTLNTPAYAAGGGLTASPAWARGEALWRSSDAPESPNAAASTHLRAMLTAWLHAAHAADPAEAEAGHQAARRAAVDAVLALRLGATVDDAEHAACIAALEKDVLPAVCAGELAAARRRLGVA